VLDYDALHGQINSAAHAIRDNQDPEVEVQDEKDDFVLDILTALAHSTVDIAENLEAIKSEMLS
jgi:hypothetical protein